MKKIMVVIMMVLSVASFGASAREIDKLLTKSAILIQEVQKGNMDANKPSTLEFRDWERGNNIAIYMIQVNKTHSKTDMQVQISSKEVKDAMKYLDEALRITNKYSK